MNSSWSPPASEPSVGPASPAPVRPLQRRLAPPWVGPVLCGLSMFVLASLAGGATLHLATRHADRMPGASTPVDPVGRDVNGVGANPKTTESAVLELPTAEVVGLPTMPTSFAGTEPVPTIADPSVRPATSAVVHSSDTTAVPATPPPATPSPTTPPSTTSPPNTTVPAPSAVAVVGTEPPATNPQPLCVPERLPSGLFDPNQAVIRAEYAAQLEALAARLISTSGHIHVHGHTDNRETMAYGGNQQLSEARAEAIEQYLVQRGIPAPRITSQGFGADQPVETGDDPADLAQNRRVEVTVDCNG